MTTMTHPTPTPAPDDAALELLAAHRLGVIAYADPDAPCAPGADLALLLLIGDVPVGQGRTIDLMLEWQRGWNDAADAAAWAAIAEPPC